MYGVLSLIGHREYMEDYWLVDEKFLPQYNVCLYAVFDGHGGYVVAKKCKDLLPKILKKNIFLNTIGLNKPNFPKALHDTFKEMDQSFDINEDYMTGTTCLVILKAKNNLWVANCGDSRAFLNKKDENIQLTIDHKPVQRERKRIEDLQGSIVNVQGVWRVNGDLALSRSIGDKKYRPFVIPTPEIWNYPLTSSNKFFVLATDGLWDIMSCSRANNILADVYKNENLSDQQLMRVCIQGLHQNIHQKIYDNTTVVLVHLRR
jgi:serine/threonine protein phosphatase PrpC